LIKLNIVVTQFDKRVEVTITKYVLRPLLCPVGGVVHDYKLHMFTAICGFNRTYN